MYILCSLEITLPGSACFLSAQLLFEFPDSEGEVKRLYRNGL